MASYAAAMARYRAAALTPGSALAGFSSAPASPPPPLRWTWAADNGDVVRRLDDGSYHISLSRPLGNWFAEVNCTVATWPDLTCSDGRMRRMAAPTTTRMTLDGRPFDRVPVPAR